MGASLRGSELVWERALLANRKTLHQFLKQTLTPRQRPPPSHSAADLRPSRVPSLHKMPQVILLRSALVFHAAARSAGLPAA